MQGKYEICEQLELKGSLFNEPVNAGLPGLVSSRPASAEQQYVFRDFLEYHVRTPFTDLICVFKKTKHSLHSKHYFDVICTLTNKQREIIS